MQDTFESMQPHLFSYVGNFASRSKSADPKEANEFRIDIVIKRYGVERFLQEAPARAFFLPEGQY